MIPDLISSGSVWCSPRPDNLLFSGWVHRFHSKVWLLFSMQKDGSCAKTMQSPKGSAGMSLQAFCMDTCAWVEVFLFCSLNCVGGVGHLFSPWWHWFSTIIVELSELVCKVAPGIHKQFSFHQWLRWHRRCRKLGTGLLGVPASPHLPHSMTGCFDMRVMFRRKEKGVLTVSLCLLEPSRAVIEISFQAA